MPNKSPATISAILTVTILVLLAILFLLLQMIALNGASERQGSASVFFPPVVPSLPAEKTTTMREDGRTLVFQVAMDANKIEIKRAGCRETVDRAALGSRSEDGVPDRPCGRWPVDASGSSVSAARCSAAGRTSTSAKARAKRGFASGACAPLSCRCQGPMR